MDKFNSKEFISRINQKVPNIPPCRFCGGTQFTTIEQFANILIAEDMKGLSLGPQVPAGMVVCSNCGHIAFLLWGH